MHSTIKVDGPLGPDAFTLRTMNARDELGRLFDYELELLATDPEVNPRDLLGRDMTVSIGLPDGAERHFNGYVTSLTYRGRSGRNGVYRARLSPWLWFLTRTANCRIFQNKSVPDIIALVFQQRGFGNVEESLSGSYRTWEYLVQYRETDFQFVTRLMELEGIYYYFRHDAGKHTLVLADGHGAHETVPGYAELPYYEASQGARREREHIRHWNVVQAVQPGSYVLDNYDFKRPRAVLQVSTSAGHAHEHDDYEIYDYPGPYEQTNDGEDYARVKLESLHANFERISASTDARGLACGALFSLTDHPGDDQNTEYLVVSTDCALHGSGDHGGDNSFDATFHAMRSSKPFRLASVTPKPVVHGPQTAKVVGKSGEEIYTDEYGRVKVQFPWDREGGSDENSSCWVRVSQVMAGNSWGAMHVPRIGQEVVVSFLEGDPDRPLITGRVYNGNNMPPFGLPGKGMVSGIKTDSTKGGGGYNEISLDDTKGKEKVVIHGQYDMETTIEHDQSLLVHNDRGATIDANDSESVGKNQTINIGADQSITIGSSQDLTVGSNQFVTVAINAAETVGAAKELSVGGAYAVTVGAALQETVTGSKAESIGGSRSISVGGTSGEDVKGAKTTTSAKSISMSAKENVNVSSDKKMALTSKEDFAVSGQKKGVFEFADELSIKVGSAELTLKKNGDITLKGKKITVNGSGDVVLKGSKVTAN